MNSIRLPSPILSYANPIMRMFIGYLVIFSVLFVGMESAADVVVDGYPHEDITTHQAEFGHQLDAHEDGTPDRELDGEHCNHCCHGHSTGIATSIFAMTPIASTDQPHAGRSDHMRNLAQAPPTPPPNA